MKEKIYEIVADSGIWMMNKIFPEYFAKDPLRPTDRYIEYPFALENIPKKPTSILDVGCSGSMLPVLIQSLGHFVHGIDIRDCPLDIHFRKESIVSCSIPSNFFEVITAISTIEHIGLSGRYGVQEGEFDDILAVNEIYRILQPQGLFLMTVPFGNKYKQEKFHRIYDFDRLKNMLTKFTYTIDVKGSPEAKYELALIKAVK